MQKSATQLCICWTILQLISTAYSENQTISESPTEVPITTNNDDTKQLSKFNLISQDCGASLEEANVQCRNAEALLTNNGYMMAASNQKIWFTIKMCQKSVITSIHLGNTELFSSIPKYFKVYLSDDTIKWRFLGIFHLNQKREIQKYQIKSSPVAKYIRFEIDESFGTEKTLIISSVKVIGTLIDPNNENKNQMEQNSAESNESSDLTYMPCEVDESDDLITGQQSKSVEKKIFEISQFLTELKRESEGLVKIFDSFKKAAVDRFEKLEKVVQQLPELKLENQILKQKIRDIEKRLWVMEVFVLISFSIIICLLYKLQRSHEKILVQSKSEFITALDKRVLHFFKKATDSMKDVESSG